METYKQEMLKKIEVHEQTEALELIHPSVPVTLDYLINVLSRGIERQKDYIERGIMEQGGDERIDLWMKTKDQLGNVRKLY